MGVQVTELTLNKKCYEKEFIDFEFDGKHVSEFGMVAVFDGDRHTFDTAPIFENETSSVNGVHGQYYWGTHFSSLKRTFMLATDGMSEAQVNAFKLHFKPGKYGKFIEDKLMHRYGYARIASAITFNVIPFRAKKTLTIGGIERTIYVNEYKGDCRITFEWDFPYMYSTEKYLQNITDDNFEENLRAMYNNGTPLGTSWQKASKCHIGDSVYSLKNGTLLSNITHSSSSGANLIYYNPSTTKTDCKITMQFMPKFTSSGWPVYFSEIADSINNIGNGVQYNTISITKALPIDTIIPTTDDYIQEFHYSTPNTINSINRAIQIAQKYYNESPSGTMLDLEERLRLEIVNAKVMGWAASVLRIMAMRDAFYDATGSFKNGTISVNCSMINRGIMNLNWFQYFNVYMLLMVAECADQRNFHLDNLDGAAGSWSFNKPYTIIFDGINSRTIMRYSYNQIIYADSLSKFPDVEEICGDMIYSSYLNLDGGDSLDDNGIIQTCHHMKFIEGKNNTQPIEYLTLEYEHTYI